MVLVTLTAPQQQHFSLVFCKSRILRTSPLPWKQLQIPHCNVSLLLRDSQPRRSYLPLLLFHLHSLSIRHSFLLRTTTTTFPSLLRRPRTSSLSPAMSSLTNSNPATETNKVVIKGRVQGVFYRDWTVQNAIELDLKGWVRNKRDCSVEALFSGPSEKVQEMIMRCRRGPPAASVTGLEVYPSDEDPGTGFERRRTA